ncbi:MAG: hypothetical protein Q7I92_09255, partial [Humidesulfovibrio sp.]|nr:hypothetical protein [Humidesulfovibrio sp.]
MSPKILKILGLLVVVAALKLTVLGALGFETWEELKGEGLSSVPQAFAAARSSKAKTAPKTAKDAAQEAPQAETGMLDQAAIPGLDVKESPQASNLKRREDEVAAKERALISMEKSLDEKLAELKRAEESIKSLLDAADVLKDARIKRQVDTY